MRLDQNVSIDMLDLRTKEQWSEIVNAINSHEMPPESEPQPSPEETAAIVDWATMQLGKAESLRHDRSIVIRRMNRDEYRNTILDLTGVDLDVTSFPLDPLADGFDNNGKALTISPMLMELYMTSAQKILDRGIVDGDQPKSIHYRFEPEVGDGDHSRVKYDKYNAIVHGGKNPVEGGFKVMHHNSWDRVPNARDFAVPVDGLYKIRVRAGNYVPSRSEVVESAQKILEKRLQDQMAQNPKGQKWHEEALKNDLKHFETNRIYDYGPPRLKVIQNVSGQPIVVDEFDVDAPKDTPKVYEFSARFNTVKTGISIEYAYSIPKVLENFWMQSGDSFARPTAYLDWFEIEGPIYDAWPPSSHSKILSEGKLTSSNDDEKARNILKQFMRRAYRRPVTADEITSKFNLYEAAVKRGLPFNQAIKPALVSVLCSPNFLYLCEPSSRADAPKFLNEHELATRLSYFLWSSMPDDQLFRLSSQGKLKDKASLIAEVDRMLKDSKSQSFVENFSDQWLGLREVGSNPPSQDLYPDYDRHLEKSMVEEGHAFFGEILNQDLNILNLVKSDFVVINERLARFYDIEGVRGDTFRKVKVDGKEIHRGGVVTHAAIHTITSNGTRTSPVKRGTWVMKNILGTNPGLPVANAGDIAPKVPGIDKATVRKRLEIHRTRAQCARCHNKIDPLGFALENFNAAGKWREQEGFGYQGRIQKDDPQIDASSKLPNGKQIEGVSGLQEALLEQEDLFLDCLAKKMITYALGRELGIADQPTIKDASAYVKKNGYTLRSLIHFIVTSPAFRTR